MLLRPVWADDGWKAVESLPRTGYEFKPEAVAVNDNGINGHHDAGGIGPTVELVSANSRHANGNGRAAVPVDGNRHHDEAPEP